MPIDALSIFLTLASDGVVAALVTAFYNYLMKRRQERLEMQRLRLETLSKAASYYSQLAVYNCWNLAWMLGRVANENRDYELMFYYLCNILYLRTKIIQKFGEIQLDNLEAEDTIGNLGRNIVALVNNGFGHLDTSRMRYLVDNDLPFHKFQESISTEHNRDLYQKFVHWICRPIIPSFSDLAHASSCDSF
jgi:hypothetical protein